jgi:Dyp-type peroxidase family
MSDLLENDAPIDFRDTRYHELFRRLQGNIVKGHGRDYAVYLLLELTVEGVALKHLLRTLTLTYVTSAYDQLREREQFARFRVPGSLFGNLFLTVGAYHKLGVGNRVDAWFADQGRSSRPAPNLFLNRMAAAADSFGDVLVAEDKRQPLEIAYAEGHIDALLVLADDSKSFLMRTARALMTQLERDGLARIVAVEIGQALRNEDGEGIEHFGYVDGRSQPLFLTSDFRHLEADHRIGPRTRERVSDKAHARESGRIDLWSPFAPLSLALIADPGVAQPDSFGSYYVFRKLEQDVMRFSMAEQQLADALNLEGVDRARAGAMIVGRFRDGTPLALSSTDGLIPAKANNFRYDGLDAAYAVAPDAPSDELGLKCPFQAHIRKVNPRQNVGVEDPAGSVTALADDDRSHRIVRRGITYGTRKRAPSAFQALQDLPSADVGLLFACFQRSIHNQFAFMQRRWANNINFMVRGVNENQTGLDALIGQRRPGAPILPQNWRTEYGGTVAHDGPVKYLASPTSHATKYAVNGFVRFRGGEFFFAPSLTFLLAE